MPTSTPSIQQHFDNPKQCSKTKKKKWNELERKNQDYLFFVTYRLDDSLENYLESMGKIQPS